MPTTTTEPDTTTPDPGVAQGATRSAVWGLGVMVGGALAGGALGTWSRAASEGHVGAGELGAPWVFTSFVGGALGARVAKRDGLRLSMAALASALAAATALVVAVAIHYDVGIGTVLLSNESRHIRGWGVAAVGTGIVFGGLGTLWTYRRARRTGRCAAMAMAAVLTGEAWLGIERGRYNEAIDRGSLRSSTFLMYVCLLIAGLLTSALAAPERRRVRSVVVTLALSWPAAISIDHFYAAVH